MILNKVTNSLIHFSSSALLLIKFYFISIFILIFFFLLDKTNLVLDTLLTLGDNLTGLFQ